MKTLYVNLIALAFLLPVFGGVGGGLYAQDPELFNHTWYLEKVNVNNVEYLLANYYNAEPAITEFDEVNSSIYISLCEFMCFWTTTSYAGGNLMNLSVLDECVLTGECMAPSPDLNFYRDLYFSIFHYWDSTTQTEVFNNPFTYTIQTVNSYYQLTIENDDGDWAVYNSVLLSAPGFNSSGFSIYPNPVKETLQINNSSNQTGIATIYTVNGKKLQSHFLENRVSTINVKALNPGLYFVVFESETGERVSKKFIKH